MRFPFIKRRLRERPFPSMQPEPVCVSTDEMVKFALDPEAKKKADSIYRHHFTAHFAKPLADLGFKRHGTTQLARVTGDGIYQFISFGKSALMNKMFRIDVALRPLYVPKELLSLGPFAPLGHLAGVGNRAWEYWTEEQAEVNFAQAAEMLEQFGLPWLEEHLSTQDLLRAWDREDRTVVGSRDHWHLRDHAFMFLRVGHLEKAREEFEKAQCEFKRDGRDWALRAADDCTLHLEVIEMGSVAVDLHLEEIETEMREKWKLVGW